MGFDRDKANEARVAAALLALGIQRKNSISSEDFEQVLHYAMDSLNKMQVYVDIAELNEIDRMPKEDAMTVVLRVKSKLINGIGRACDAATAALFELTFNFYLVVTTPEIISEVEPELTEMASGAGFSPGVISAILAKAETDTDSAIADFEAAADQALGASAENSGATWLEAIEIKPGVGGVSFDVKKAVSLAVKWIGTRRNR